MTRRQPPDPQFFERAKRFREALKRLESEYEIQISHEDYHGSFLYIDTSPSAPEDNWLGEAYDFQDILFR